ncbi:MAG: hypothetical protein U0264_05420 [Candidatus Kapaibacterium sp.]
MSSERWNQSKKSFAQQLKEEREKLFGKSGRKLTSINPIPIENPFIPILSTTTEEVQMPELPEIVQDSKRDPLANIFTLEPFISHGDEIIEDFVTRSLSLADLVLKYGVKLSTDDYKFYIVAKIGKESYKEVIRSKRRIQALNARASRGSKEGSKETATEIPKPTATESTTEQLPSAPEDNKQNVFKLLGHSIGHSTNKISVELPTGLPFTIPNFEPSNVSDQAEALGTDTPSPEEPEVVDSMVTAIRDFMFSTTMLDLAYFYPAIWEVLHKHIVRKIGRAEYDTAVINRLYTVTDELSRAQ